MEAPFLKAADIGEIAKRIDRLDRVAERRSRGQK
jgi:hypothetical protein